LKRRRWHWHCELGIPRQHEHIICSTHPWYRAGFPVNLITRYRTADGSDRPGKLASWEGH
jgi:hypothetical protein